MLWCLKSWQLNFLFNSFFKLRTKRTTLPEILLWMHPANERRRYNVTSSLIGWAHSQNAPCITCSLWGESTGNLGVSTIGHWSDSCLSTISVPVYGRPAGILGYQRNILEQLGWSKKSNLTQTPLCHTRGPCPVWHIDTLRARHNGHHFADDIFKYISLNENFWIFNKISLKYVP